jgi:hypothetical protein
MPTLERDKDRRRLDLVDAINAARKTSNSALRAARIDQKSALDLAAGESWTMKEELKDSLARRAGQVGERQDRHHSRMARLNIESQNERVDIMHFNDLLMPSRRPMRATPEIRALFRAITRAVLPFAYPTTRDFSLPPPRGDERHTRSVI